MTIDNNTNLTYNYNINDNKQNSALEKIAAGIAINRASDDASGLAIANSLMAEANAYGTAIQNGNSAVAMTQIADGALGAQSNILDTVNQKLLQASTSTTSDEGRAAILKDVQKLMENYDQIASNTNYNGTTLLQASKTDQSASSSLSFQMGSESGDTITTSGEVQSNSVGAGLDGLLSETADSFTADQARSYIDTVSDAMTQVNSYRSDFGSTQNQLQASITSLMEKQVNTEAAKSIIIDTDYAKESSNFSSMNVISQAGSYAMSQANAAQANVMRLLTQ